MKKALILLVVTLFVVGSTIAYAEGAGSSGKSGWQKCYDAIKAWSWAGCAGKAKS